MLDGYTFKERPNNCGVELTHSCKASKTNSHYLPEKISGPLELACNLCRSRRPEGRALFKHLGRRGWYLSSHNPVKMINRMNLAAICGVRRRSFG